MVASTDSDSTAAQRLRLRQVDSANRPRICRVVRDAMGRDTRGLAEAAATGTKHLGCEYPAQQPRQFVHALIGQREAQDAKVTIRRHAPPEVANVDGHE